MLAPPFDFAPFSATISTSLSIENVHDVSPLNLRGLMPESLASEDLPFTRLNISFVNSGVKRLPFDKTDPILFTSVNYVLGVNDANNVAYAASSEASVPGCPLGALDLKGGAAGGAKKPAIDSASLVSSSSVVPISLPANSSGMPFSCAILFLRSLPSDLKPPCRGLRA